MFVVPCISFVQPLASVGFADFHDNLQELRLRVDVAEEHLLYLAKLPACGTVAISVNEAADVDGRLVHQ